MAIAALVLGILALALSFTVVGGIVLGILALVFGLVAARRAKRGDGGGRGMATAGWILGLIGIVLAVVLIVVGVSILNSPSGKTLRSCLSDAGSDQTKVQQCEDQFRNNINGS